MFNYKFFEHKECEYYPCHNFDRINCLFCYCPLYPLGINCGGNFSFTEKGIKDCTNCEFPHNPDNYDMIVEKLRDLAMHE